MRPKQAARFGCHRGQPAGEARGQKEPGFDRDVVGLKRSCPAGRRLLPAQDGMGRKEGREHDDVAEQKNPEAEADNHRFDAGPPSPCPVA